MLDMRVWKYKMSGIPIEYIIPTDSGVIPNLNPVCLIKNALHPNAAKLFIDFMLSLEGQKAFLSETGHHSWHEGWTPVPQQINITDVKVTPIDYKTLRSKISEVQTTFTEMVAG